MENLKLLNSIKVRKKRSSTKGHGSSVNEAEIGPTEARSESEGCELRGKRPREEEVPAEESLLRGSPYLGKAHPFNLVYLDYLEKMKRSTKTVQRMSMIKKAINSIKQYPAPIISPQQFQILEGIGNYLGSQLERLVRPDRVDQLKELEEYQQKCMEFRQSKINDLNLLVDPILDQNPEADSSLLEALEQEAKEESGQAGASHSKGGGGVPQIYGEKWNVLVVIALLQILKPSRDIDLERIQGFCGLLQEFYEPKMALKKAEKTLKQLVKQDLVCVNRRHYKIQGFPIESEKISYNLTEKGVQASTECLKSNELFYYIYTNFSKDQFSEIMSRDSLLDIVQCFDKRRRTKVFTDYEIVMIIDYREVNTGGGDFAGYRAGTSYGNDEPDKHGVADSYSSEMSVASNPSFGGSKSSGIPKYLLNRLNDQGVKIELKNLPIGDVIWVARPKLEGKDEKTPIDESFVLPWIVERKTGSDMCSSILDGRYEEQKYRLMRSIGVENVIYLLEDLNSIHENIVWSNSSNGPISSGRIAPKQVLRSAQANTQFITGFHILQSQSTGHTLNLLVGMHQVITENVRSRWCGSISRDQDGLESEVINGIARDRPSFKDWEAHSKKSSNLTVEETFGKQLRSIKGCGPEATEALLSMWPTPYDMYEEMSSEITFEDLYSKVLKRCDEIRSARSGSKKKHKASVSRDLLFHLYCLFSENIQNGDSDQNAGDAEGNDQHLCGQPC
ncbi:conserved possible MUS81 endonuclease [Cryptosporidium canis]|uniref:Crossover junction endonuclease MUS81 n=1 Tax=Cryptosporidium canis TaxID=195482 RepID=A0ABQ8PAY3_9CRYT|nr:conserved possible MUS81 endonuclease [Cryptosporidium canis]